MISHERARAQIACPCLGMSDPEQLTRGRSLLLRLAAMLTANGAALGRIGLGLALGSEARFHGLARSRRKMAKSATTLR
jgi:hypothetical protein